MEFALGKKWLWQYNKELGTYEVYNVNGDQIENKIALFHSDILEQYDELDEFLNIIVGTYNNTIVFHENDILYAKLTQRMLRLVRLRTASAPRELIEMEVGHIYEALDAIVDRDRASSKYFQQAFESENDTDLKD